MKPTIYRILRTKVKDLSTMSKYEEDNGQIGIIRPWEIVFIMAISPLIAITILFIVAHADTIEQYIQKILNTILL
jgi:hypothetical protein